MAIKKKRIKLDKKDYLRALLTDTAPDDIPIIFSNDGFYINAHRAKNSHTSKLNTLIKTLYLQIVEPEDISKLKSQSFPLKYRITKNDVSLRTLSLAHPRAQKNFVNFYKNYSDVITYLCSFSPFSIRAPEKVGNSIYSYNIDPLNKYKEINIDTLESELNRRHASSYFTYRGYNRIYKLFSNPQFIQLEKSYRIMWKVDVANCFDTIYSHTISWAVKNKKFIKKHTSFSNQFCQEFDTLVQRSNNNETNGIPVGSEISRIFAEIIFQDIDLQIIENLELTYQYKNGIDYEILRYVDDFLIFSNSDKDATRICSVVPDCLNKYNLYINDSKLNKYKRPFSTEKSNTISQLNVIINNFESSLFVKKKVKRNILIAKSINRKDRFIHVFIDKVKNISKNDASYSDVSSYLVSVFSRRIIFLIESADKFYHPAIQEQSKSLEFRKAICIMLELISFFYTVNATVSSSNKFAKTIIIVDRFFKNKLPHFTPFIRSLIMDNVKQLSLIQDRNNKRDGFVSFESLNVLLATSDFGENYLVHHTFFQEILNSAKEISYFEIISLLYYFKNHIQYKDLIEKTESIAMSKLDNNFDIVKDSEIAHLFLDLISCPFLSAGFRKKYLKKYFVTYAPELDDDTILEERVELLSNVYWFVKWKGADLLNILERKELKSVY